MSDREFNTFLEEKLSDIDTFIQSELGFPPLTITAPLTTAEIHSLSSMLETRGTSNESLSSNVLGNNAASFMPSIETSNKVQEVDVEIQIIGLKDVYDKKSKKTNNGIEYRLDDSEVTVVVRASEEITSVRAYTQRCAEAAIKTHDTIGPVELEVNTLQSDPRCRVVAVDLGSVYNTREGSPVYCLEKADVMKRNKWEIIIAMEFGSGLKGTVKSEAFRVTTKARYKMNKTEDLPSNGKEQRLLCKFTRSDKHDLTDLSRRNNFLRILGIQQEFPDRDACALNREFMAFNLKEEEEDDCTRQCEFAKKSRSDLNSKSDPLSNEKILFHNHTVLNKHMVTAYYGHNPKIDYVVEQPELSGLLKVVGKRFLQVSGNGHKSTADAFWWACGHCFFERRKKSTIKAHVIQRVCQKPIEVKTRRRKVTSRHLSQGEIEEDKFKGCSWKRRSFSV